MREVLNEKKRNMKKKKFLRIKREKRRKKDRQTDKTVLPVKKLFAPAGPLFRLLVNLLTTSLPMSSPTGTGPTVQSTSTAVEPWRMRTTCEAHEENTCNSVYFELVLR